MQPYLRKVKFQGGILIIMNIHKITDKFNIKRYMLMFSILNLLYIILTAYKLNISKYYINNNLDLKEYFVNTKGISNGILFLEWLILLCFIVNLLINLNPIEKYKQFIKSTVLLTIVFIIISGITFLYTEIWFLNFLQQLIAPLLILAISFVIKAIKRLNISLLTRK